VVTCSGRDSQIAFKWLGRRTVTQNWEIWGLIQTSKTQLNGSKQVHNALRVVIPVPAIRPVQGWPPKGHRVAEPGQGIGYTIQNESHVNTFFVTLRLTAPSSTSPRPPAPRVLDCLKKFTRGIEKTFGSPPCPCPCRLLALDCRSWFSLPLYSTTPTLQDTRCSGI
jgi:hypothetical protein